MQPNGWRPDLRINNTAITTNFLYECILIKFGCPLTIVTYQGVHFINDFIKHLIDHVLLKYVSSIIDALPSPGENPLEGSTKCSCGKLGLGRCSRLPTLERSRGSSWEPRD
jgi:hypothetical protein